MAQIWRVSVGRVPLFLLDADVTENGQLDRWITSQLTSLTRSRGSRSMSCWAWAGARWRRWVSSPVSCTSTRGTPPLRCSNWPAERLARGASLQEALARARQRTVFTTHTPVAAGNETYSAEEVAGAIDGLARDLDIDRETLLGLGRMQSEDRGEPFGMTTLSLRMSRSANGVSRRHGEVAREMWRGLWPDRELAAVPITHVTNGVHLSSWIGSPMRRLFERYLGEGWWRGAHDPATWEAIAAVSDAELWRARCEQRAELVEFVKYRSGVDRLAEHQPRAQIEAAARGLIPTCSRSGSRGATRPTSGSAC